MSKKDATILVIDDNEDILISARLLLKQKFKEILTTKDPNELNVLLSRNNIDIILLDMNFRVGINDGKAGLYWLNHIHEINKNIIVILMTAYGEVSLAVDAMKKGAFDFLLKPWVNEKLIATVTAGLALKASKDKVDALETSNEVLKKAIDHDMGPLIGQSEPMQALMEVVKKVSITDAEILLLGENGTGKHHIAKLIHQHSKRGSEPFIHVDLGSLSETLFESELFGYKKGAFTDAKEDKIGRFEMANGGTLFLDEIGNLPLNLQAKLLTVLQEKKIVRLGEGIQRSVDVRLIFATNAPLKQWVNDGKFRQDLLFRINTIEIEIPPLRHRTDDIPLFIDHFLKQFSLKYKKGDLNISPEAKATLMSHSWPGNIREMQHIMERGVIMSNGAEIRQSDFNLSVQETPNAINIDDKDNLNLQEIEIMLIQKAIAKHQGNISKAAKELGLTRAALYRRMEKFNL
ncbi:MAG: sigma-54 dependent transcriptional regulator [Chitinophagales bacterium]